jgi:hypothetical protein
MGLNLILGIVVLAALAGLGAAVHHRGYVSATEDAHAAQLAEFARDCGPNVTTAKGCADTAHDKGVADQVESNKAAAALIEQAQRKRVTELEQQAQAAEAQARQLRTKLAQEKAKNVTATADRLCSLTIGVVRDHDANVAAALSGDPAQPAADPGVPADTPSGVTISGLTDTIDANYSTCGEWRRQVIGWQKWAASTGAPIQSP